ncbi:MAG: D-alanyl-D-alanine dipeptidase [Thermoleophilia bacterium]|nr:D-alanyl-D-alanine dipeptidase [Thermoleophilia bacterium]
MSTPDDRCGRPIPRLLPPTGWRDVATAPVNEPLVPIAGLHSRIVEDPRYFAMGLPGSLPACWVRAGVGKRLVRVAESLPGDLVLLIWDGWRSIPTQSALFEAYVEELAQQYPDLAREDLDRMARPYVTPPDPGHHAPPPHLTGGAVDLTLAQGDGTELDLGTGFDAFVPEAGSAALEDIDIPARAHRRLLFHAMTDAGFTAYREEWWHFDYGNQFWGAVTGRPAIYGPADGSRA